MFSLRYRHNTGDPTMSPSKSHHHQDQTDFKPCKRESKEKKQLTHTHQVSITFFIAMMVRYWHSGTPHFITQSELLLAQEINWTLKGQFYIGSSPPLATLMYSFVANCLGYHGVESILYAGQTLHEFPLTSLRQLTMFISALVIPVIYTLMRVVGCAHTTALFTCGLFVFESSTVVQSRFLSVNPLSILLSCLACCCFFSTPPLSKFRRQCWTGIFVGCALCTKWHAGFLAVFFLAVSGFELWKKLGDPTQSLKQVPKWIGIPSFTLMILPITIYISLFQWHFYHVPNAGDHDFFLSSSLRYSLNGNTFEPVQQYIAYGSHVVLKHVSSNNGYLHSDDKIFEGGSNQNQVTVYPYEDMNNIWVIQKLDGKTYADKDPEYLYNNNAFKLEHYASTRKLHSHDHKAPVHTGEGFYEVTSYGNPTVTEDGNDVWWIRTVTEDEGYDTTNFDPINALTTRFRLLHHQGCYLASHYDPLTLVEGGAQQEVSCMNSAKTTVSSWVFEYAHHPKLEDISPMVEYGSPTTIKKLKQVHDLMKNYKKVVYDRLSSVPPDETEPTDTMMYSGREPQPFHWLKSTYAYLIWDDLTGRSVLVVLHPMLRYLTLSALALFPLIAVFSAFAFQLHWSHSMIWCQEFWSNRHIKSATMMLGGVLIHAIGVMICPPHTVTLSDMFPSILFGTFSTSCLFEWFSTQHRHPNLFLLLIIIMTLAILYFASWSRGIDGSTAWTNDQCKQFQIKNIDCEKYPAIVPDLTVSFDDDDGPISVMDPQLIEGADHPQENHDLESRHIMMPGTPLRFEYERGQEMRAEMEIAKVRENAYREAVASLIKPAHRFVRATFNQGPTLEEITQVRHQMHLYVLEKQAVVPEGAQHKEKRNSIGKKGQEAKKKKVIKKNKKTRPALKKETHE